MKIKKLIPSSLLGRSLIIVFVPTITVVLLTTFVFYKTSWDIISKRLTQSVSADIQVIIKLIDHNKIYKYSIFGQIIITNLKCYFSDIFNGQYNLGGSHVRRHGSK